MTWIDPDQLSASIRRMSAFRDAVNKQLAQHIYGFLALKWANVGTTQFTPYSEADDFKFFDKFLKVRAGEYPYFDPIACSYRIKSHPHSNVATARKGTFFRTWHAGEMRVESGEESWRFKRNYIDILRGKALTKAGVTTLIPAEALAAFLFRQENLPQRRSLSDHLRSTFHLTDAEFSQLFDASTVVGMPSATQAMSDSAVISAIEASGVVAQERETHDDFSDLAIPDTDKNLILARQLLFDDKYSGVVLVGPPGTSKSWYANQIALSLADGDKSRIFKVQFHKSYQYENFVEGFVPNDDGRFHLQPQLIMNVATQAAAQPETSR
jgi:5-methylcytosine-specific restriction protein B